MKSRNPKEVLLPVLAAVVVANGASAQEVAPVALGDIGLLPHEKESVQIPANERNPFDLPVAFEPAKEEFEDTTLQAQKIMGRLNSFTIDGVVKRPDGKIKVLMSDMILEEGVFVPPVVPGQTERLKVTKITEEELEITWIEEEDIDGYRNPQARVFRKRLGIDPSVTQVLRGARTETGAAKVLRTMGDQQQELSDATRAGGLGR